MGETLVQELRNFLNVQYVPVGRRSSYLVAAAYLCLCDLEYRAVIMDPKGKVALVTGGAMGIGFHTCKELLRSGVKRVSVCDVNLDAGENAVKELCEEFGRGKAAFIRTDVTKAADFEEAFKKTIKENGGLDIVFNNAGIANDKQWEKEIDINLTAVVGGTLLGLQYMGKDKGGKGGVIVNMASICGLYTLSPLPVYTATKHGVVALTQSLGGDYHYNSTGVRIVAMCPGITSTALFHESTSSLYDDKWSPEWDSICSKLKEQGPEFVARGIVQMVEKAESATVWVSEEEKPLYQVKMELKKVD